MVKKFAVLALAALLVGCTAIGNIALPSKEEVASALQSMFDSYTESGGKPKAWSVPTGSAPQVASLEITKWKLIKDTYLVADVHVTLAPKDPSTVQTDRPSVNFRLLMQRRERAWILLDLVPIGEPQIVET